jgi:hypothetical protein
VEGFVSQRVNQSEFSIFHTCVKLFFRLALSVSFGSLVLFAESSEHFSLLSASLLSFTHV